MVQKWCRSGAKVVHDCKGWNFMHFLGVQEWCKSGAEVVQPSFYLHIYFVLCIINDRGYVGPDHAKKRNAGERWQQRNREYYLEQKKTPCC